MSHIGDSRADAGPGIIPIEYTGSATGKGPTSGTPRNYGGVGDEMNRGNLLAVSISGREDSHGGLDGGDWIYNSSTVGAIRGPLLWKIRNARMHWWSWVYSTAITGSGPDETRKGAKKKGPTSGTPAPLSRRQPGNLKVEVLNTQGISDAFEPITWKPPSLFPSFPYNFEGLTVASPEQPGWPMFHATDPRIPIINAGKDPMMGAMCVDTDPDGFIDESRTARLHSPFRILKRPSNSPDNAIGIHMGYSGHSLLAVKVFSEIESVFGKKLPLATLFEAPTVEKLVGALSEEGFADVFPPVVHITSHGTGTPFFAVATADAFVFADLARRMEPKRPFYALHPQGIVRNDRPEIDLVDLARRYIEEMKKLQPKGPYAIGGTCAAGIVAYEMAQQLKAAGDDVHFVAMFDSPGPFDLSRKLSIAAAGAKRFGRHMRTHAGNLAGLDNRGRLEYIRMRLARLGRKLRGLAVPPDTPQTDRPVEQAYWMAFNGAYGRAVARYKPRRFDGRLVLFLAEDQAAWRFSHSRLRWKQLVGGKVELFRIPGSHQEMLRGPQADAVARHLSALLSQIDGA